MKCGNCGTNLPPNGVRCLRCGWVFNSIATLSEDEQAKNEKTEVKNIPPSQVHVSKASGSFGGGDIFGGMFGGGGFGSIINDLFGGFFGEEESEGYEYDPKHYDDFGNEIYLPDEFERDCVEIQVVEQLEQEQENKKHKKKNKDDKDKS